MDRNSAKLVRFTRGAQEMSPFEREAMREAMQAAQDLKDLEEAERLVELITAIGAARGRVAEKRASDKRTDRARRKLVGARLDRAQAQRCARCAQALGVSGYRFAADALAAACECVEEGQAVDGQSMSQVWDLRAGRA